MRRQRRKETAAVGAATVSEQHSARPRIRGQRRSVQSQRTESNRRPTADVAPKPVNATAGPFRGQQIGVYIPNCKTFQRNIDSKKHRLAQGYAIDLGALRFLQEQGCQYVRLEDDLSGFVYEAPLQAFFDEGEEIDYGYGGQLALPVKKFNQRLTAQMVMSVLN